MPLTFNQKVKKALIYTFYCLFLPVGGAIGLYFLIDNMDAAKIPKSITKNLWIPIGAVAFLVFSFLIAYVRLMYNLFYKEETITRLSQKGDEQIDYHNIIYWIMSILLFILFIIVLINNYS